MLTEQEAEEKKQLKFVYAASQLSSDIYTVWRLCFTYQTRW